MDIETLAAAVRAADLYLNSYDTSAPSRIKAETRAIVEEAMALLKAQAQAPTTDISIGPLEATGRCVRCGAPTRTPQSRYCAICGRDNYNAHRRGEW